MTQEEANINAKDNLLVADYFFRQAQDFVYQATTNGKLPENAYEDVKHYLGCASAHMKSALDYLRGDFTSDQP